MDYFLCDGGDMIIFIKIGISIYLSDFFYEYYFLIKIITGNYWRVLVVEIFLLDFF